ncbi:hypothetical protein GLO73106DRAFT_00035030, partial [Gloeocapsa sp. PCC 73106]
VGGQYQPIEPNEQGWLWSNRLGLYLGVYQQQLRYFTQVGELVPLPEELVQQAQLKAQQAEEKVEQLKAQLRALGIEPQ